MPSGASGVWFGNEQWPSGSSPGAFARDVFRLENCKTDREKAFAFNTWLVRCMNRGPNLRVPGLGGYVHCSDPTTLFTSWGHNECTGWGFVAVEALQSAGLKARRVGIGNAGHSHTVYEVWYKGLDGKEGWHLFDPFLGWYLLNDAGEVPSCDELAANPDLVVHPRPGGRSRLGHNPERSGALSYPFKTGDFLGVEQPKQGFELRYEPRPGMVFANLWRPELPDLASRDPGRNEGAHCDITPYDEEGKPRYVEHQPYWQHYVWPSENSSGINGTLPVRWHGCGALRWRPLEHGAEQCWSAREAVFENGTLRPTGSRKHCEVWWHIRLPYLASYLRIQSNFATQGGEWFALALSTDGGRSLHPLYYQQAPPPPVMTIGPTDAPGVRNLQEFWIRLDMSSQHKDPRLACRALQFTVGYQLNMHILPRLLPGVNELSLQADRADGVKLQAEWAWTRGAEDKVETVALKPGEKRAALSVDTRCERPDDLVMRGVTLRCLPAGS